MHRTEGDNNVNNLYAEGPPGTIVTASAMNAIQEEIANVIEGAGLQLKSAATDVDYNQLLQAIQALTNAGYDAVINTQDQFNDIIERTAANQYKIKDDYSSVFIKNSGAGGYLCSGSTSFLSGGDSYGVLSLNQCKELTFETGAYLNTGDTGFYLNVDADYAKLTNVWIKGAGGTATVNQCYLLGADYVTFETCYASDLDSDAAFTGFMESSTSSHNDTVLYQNCKVFNLSGDVYRNGFSYNVNLKNCFEDGALVVPKVTWTTVQTIGSGTSVTGDTPIIRALSQTRIAVVNESTNDLRAYDFNGSTWSLVGSGFSLGTVVGGALATLNSTDVAYIDGGNDELRTYRFNGSTWSLVGSALSINVSIPAMDALNSTDVVMFDSANDELRTYRFNGSTWSLVGSALSMTGLHPDFATLNSTDVAFIDEENDELRTYRFNGSTWSLVGSALSISVSDPSLAALNSTDVALADSGTDTIRIYRFNGSTWSLISFVTDVTAGNSSMAAISSNSIVYLAGSGGSDNFTTYLFNHDIG